MPGSVGVTNVSIDDSGVSTSENVTGEFSAIIDIEVPRGYRYEFVPNHPVEMYVPTHESHTVTTDSGTETVNLSNNLVNSPSVSDVATSSSETAINGQRDLVVWDDTEDDQVGVASVDYDANSFDYTTGDTTDDPLEIWYLWGDSSQVEFRTYPPSEEGYDKELIRSMRSFHQANVFGEHSKITFPEPFTLMEKEHLKINVKTDVDLTNWDVQPGDASSPGNFETYGYADFSFPVRKVPMKQ